METDRRIFGSESLPAMEELREMYENWLAQNPQIEQQVRQGFGEQVLFADELMQVREGLRIFHFGIYLVKKMFGVSSVTVLDPRVNISKRGGGSFMARVKFDPKKGAPSEILINTEVLLRESLGRFFSDERFAYYPEAFTDWLLVAVEEFSHWAWLETAWKGRPEKKTRALDAHLERHKEAVKVLMKSNQMNAMMLHIIEAERAGIEVLGGITKKYIGDELSRILVEIDISDLNYNATDIEYMGIVWQRLVAMKYFPGSSAAEEIDEKYREATILRRGRTRADRQRRD